uniref:Putative secreted protein n=1 Tax=Anopheles marajoara TaxID=58244 RepID=A0A2M4CAC4_9DIPT
MMGWDSMGCERPLLCVSPAALVASSSASFTFSSAVRCQQVVSHTRTSPADAAQDFSRDPFLPFGVLFRRLLGLLRYFPGTAAADRSVGRSGATSI